MNSWFEPNYPVITFFFFKKFIFFEVVALLALIRFFIGPWLSRFFALIALAGSLAALAIIFGPAAVTYVEDVRLMLDHPQYPQAVQVINMMNGMAAPLAVSVPFLLSSFSRKGRGVWIDFAFTALLFMLLIFWGATTYLV